MTVTSKDTTFFDFIWKNKPRELKKAVTYDFVMQIIANNILINVGVCILITYQKLVSCFMNTLYCH